jgi:pectinesterase
MKSIVIKKTAVIVSCCIALMFATGFDLFADTGDVNGNGIVDIVDALLIAQFYVGLNPANFDQSFADVNGDAGVTIVDALIIAQVYVGLQTPFPASEVTPDATPVATAAPTATPGNYNLTVAKDGSGNYATVQAAINAAPDNGSSWFTIYIKNGSYKEVITVASTKTYLRLLGQSATGTILTYDNCSDTAGGTSASASVFIKANNFIAQNITFENSFDYNNSSYTNKQAVAAEPQADRQIYSNCRFTGYQDTLYCRAGRQFFKSCYISGLMDYIFGEGTAVFSNCEIYSRNRSSGCVSAPSTPSSSAYGLVFLTCNLTGESLSSNTFWLGRPWHPSSSTGVNSSATYLYCALPGFIRTEGWTSMSGVSPSTERMKEYKNTGAGAVVNSTRPQLSDSEAAAYTVKNILKGSDNWDPESVLAGM